MPTTTTHPSNLDTPDVAQKAGVVRLSVNLAADVADALKQMSVSQGMTVTQGVRKAIVLWKLVTDETSKGNRVMIVEGEGPDATYREIVLV